MTARMARITLTAGPSTLHQRRGPAWRPAALLPEGEHADPPAPTDPPPAPAPAPTPAPPKPADPAPAPASDSLDISKLDPAVQKLISDLRAENGKDRTAAKAKAAEDAAKAARDEVAQTIGKALGIIKDDETLDPAELAKKVTEATAKATRSEVRLAVFEAAIGKADPKRLLNRVDFRDQIDGLDLASKTFATDVAKAIDDAVKNDPTLKATGQAPGASAVPAAGGSGENGRVRATSLGAAIEAQRVASTTT